MLNEDFRLQRGAVPLTTHVVQGSTHKQHKLINELFTFLRTKSSKYGVLHWQHASVLHFKCTTTWTWPSVTMLDRTGNCDLPPRIKISVTVGFLFSSTKLLPWQSYPSLLKTILRNCVLFQFQKLDLNFFFFYCLLVRKPNNWGNDSGEDKSEVGHKDVQGMVAGTKQEGCLMGKGPTEGEGASVGSLALHSKWHIFFYLYVTDVQIGNWFLNIDLLSKNLEDLSH